MNIKIKDFKIAQNNKKQILIDLNEKTTNIDKITVISYDYDTTNNSLILKYWFNNTLSFQYELINFKSQHLSLIKKKEYLFIRELNNKGIYYPAVNKKHVKI
jgi:hypothetical protein